MTDLLADIGVILVAMAAAFVAIGLLAKSPYFGKPLRWLWTTNVSHPVGAWAEKLIRQVVGEHIEYLMHHHNSGSSLLDLAEAVEGVKKHVDLLVAHDAERDVAGRRYGHGGAER